MKPYQTILVAAALDGRDETTLRHVAYLAQLTHARDVYLAHVVPTFDLPETLLQEEPEAVVPVDEEIEARLRQTVARVPGGFGEAEVHCVARQGSAVAELTKLAAQKAADLLCLGRTGDPNLLGQPVDNIVRKAPCSVFLIPAGSVENYSRILAPIDFSEHSKQALETACALARGAPNASLTALHVYQVPLGWHKSGHSHEEFAAIMRKHAERHWQTFSRDLETQGVSIDIRFELGEEVTNTILETADAMDASLIVVGSHGRTLPAELLLGHVADSVCAQSTRPTLCVKHKGEVVNLLKAILQFYGFGD